MRRAGAAERAFRVEDQAGALSSNRGGNEQLTALAGILLIVFLAVEGATLLSLRALPIVALKMGSTGWRMARYYLGGEEYVRRVVATSAHVLFRLARVRHALRARYPGLALRLGVVTVTLVAGAAVAAATLPGADHLQDRMSVRVGLDAR